jgi:hypothetical protein
MMVVASILAILVIINLALSMLSSPPKLGR